MKININYIDNDLFVDKERILCLEVLNKKFFYRLINDFNLLENGEILEEIAAYDENYSEISLTNKIEVINDYINFDNYNKKYSNDYAKFVIKNLDDNNISKILKKYGEICNIFSSALMNIDAPFVLKENNELDAIVKLFKYETLFSYDLLNNLCNLLIIKNIFFKNKIFIFINLKSYLSNNDLLEFYKFVKLNELSTILVDSSHYSNKNEIETKLTIDNDLDEFIYN